MAAPAIGVIQNPPARPGMPLCYLPDYPRFEGVVPHCGTTPS